MFMLLLACCATAALDTWVVDDNHPADFGQISTAISAAAAGDVLLVEPGTYVGFTLDKRLTIIGRAGGARPHVTGTVRLNALSGFTFAGFDVDDLRVGGVQGRGRIDDCSVNFVSDHKQVYAAVVSDCAQLVISRTRLSGSAILSWTKNGCGLHVSGSHVALVDCTVRGGPGISPSDGDETDSSAEEEELVAA